MHTHTQAHPHNFINNKFTSLTVLISQVYVCMHAPPPPHPPTQSWTSTHKNVGILRRRKEIPAREGDSKGSNCAQVAAKFGDKLVSGGTEHLDVAIVGTC